MNPRPLLDPGWLFLLAGLTIIGCTVLIPASDDLAEARWKRDAARAYESHRQHRLDRYDAYLGALDRREPQLVRALAASQLGEMPSDRALITAPNDSRIRNVSVFPALEPPPMTLPEPRRPVDSLLSNWILGRSGRLGLVIVGAMCIMLGLLPASKPKAIRPATR